MKATLVLVVFSMMSGATTPGGSSYERLRAYTEQSYETLAACQQELPPLFRDAKLYYMNEATDAARDHEAVDMRPTAHLLAIDTNFRISVDCYEGGPRLEKIDPAAIARTPREADTEIVLSRCDARGCGGAASVARRSPTLER